MSSRTSRSTAFGFCFRRSSTKPTRSALDAVDEDLEESARFYEEDNGELHIRSDFLIDDDLAPRNVRVAFILYRNVLFSIHAEDLPVFRLLRLRARRIPALPVRRSRRELTRARSRYWFILLLRRAKLLLCAKRA